MHNLHRSRVVWCVCNGRRTWSPPALLSAVVESRSSAMAHPIIVIIIVIIIIVVNKKNPAKKTQIQPSREESDHPD